MKGFASIAAPLHKVVGQCSDSSKGKKGGRQSRSTSITAVWSPECDEAFRNLKESLCTAPVLGLANYALPFILEVDASNQDVGAVLSQDQDGKRKVISYASRGLRKTERNMQNYSSKKLELLALKWAMTEKFREYLLGSTVTVYTDNNPLTYINTKAKHPAIEQRWVSDMASFNFTIKYKPGIRNGNADGLSRMGLDYKNLVRVKVKLPMCSPSHMSWIQRHWLFQTFPQMILMKSVTFLLNRLVVPQYHWSCAGT